MSIDEAIVKEKEMSEPCSTPCTNGCDCTGCRKEHKQLAEWLEELKALRLLLDWAIECDFGLDSFPEEYATYKHTLTDDMTYKDMMMQIAKCAVEEQLKE